MQVLTKENSDTTKVASNAKKTGVTNTFSAEDVREEYSVAKKVFLLTLLRDYNNGLLKVD